MDKIQLDHDANQSYTEYKKLQKLMTKWLIEHGEIESRKHDYQIYSPHYRLPLSEIHRLAKSVQSLGIPIPADILYMSRTMLKLRRQVALTYDDGDEGHQKCIEQFGEIISTLECLPKVSTERQYMPTRQQLLVTTDIHVNNQYVALSDDASDPVAVTNHSDVMPPYRPPSFAWKVGSLEASPVIPKQKLPAELSNPSSIDMDERVADLLKIQNLTSWIFKICFKARDGIIPLTVATYVIERAFIYIREQWKRLCYCCIGSRTPKNFTGRVPDDILEKVKEDLAEVIHQYNKLASSDSSALTMFDLCHDSDEPIMHMRLFVMFAKLSYADNTSVQHSAKPKPYAENVPVPGYNAENEHYFAQLLQDLLYDSLYRERERTKHGMFEGHSRVHLQLELLLQERNSGLHSFVRGNDLCLLLKTAQCFLYGYAKRCGMPDTTSREHQSPNYRLKTLMFAQEVHVSLKKHWTERNPFATSPHTMYNLETLRAQLEGLLLHRRFDMLTQHPLLATAISSTIMDTIYKCGIEMLSFRRTALGVLHAYSALRRLQVINEDIEILEMLCSKLVEEVFYGKRPIRRFLTAWVQLDNPANNEQSSAQEHRARKELLSGGGTGSKVFHEELLYYNSRGMVMMKEGRRWHNQRIQAVQLSLFHHVYNMNSNDMPEPIPDKVLQTIFGGDYMQHPAVIYPGRNTSKTEKNQRDAKSNLSNENKTVSREEQRLNILEKTLTKEFTEAFPLITADLMQIWHRCYQVCVAVQGSGHVLGHEHLDKAGVECALEACDEYKRGKTRQGDRGRSLGQENIDTLTEDNNVLLGWKVAIEEQFRDTILADFQWKNV